MSPLPERLPAQSPVDPIECIVSLPIDSPKVATFHLLDSLRVSRSPIAGKEEVFASACHTVLTKLNPTPNNPEANVAVSNIFQALSFLDHPVATTAIAHEITNTHPDTRRLAFRTLQHIVKDTPLPEESYDELIEAPEECTIPLLATDSSQTTTPRQALYTLIEEFDTAGHRDGKPIENILTVLETDLDHDTQKVMSALNKKRMLDTVHSYTVDHYDKDTILSTKSTIQPATVTERDIWEVADTGKILSPGKAVTLFSHADREFHESVAHEIDTTQSQRIRLATLISHISERTNGQISEAVRQKALDVLHFELDRKRELWETDESLREGITAELVAHNSDQARNRALDSYLDTPLGTNNSGHSDTLPSVFQVQRRVGTMSITAPPEIARADITRSLKRLLGDEFAKDPSFQKYDALITVMECDARERLIELENESIRRAITEEKDRNAISDAQSKSALEKRKTRQMNDMEKDKKRWESEQARISIAQELYPSLFSRGEIIISEN